MDNPTTQFKYSPDKFETTVNKTVIYYEGIRANYETVFEPCHHISLMTPLSTYNCSYLYISLITPLSMYPGRANRVNGDDA